MSGRSERYLWRGLRRTQLYRKLVNELEPDDIDGERDNSIAMRDYLNRKSDYCDGGDAERDAARVRAARGSAASGSQGGTVFAYSGTGTLLQIGDPTYAIDTQGFHLDDVVINTTSATSATAQGLAAYRTQEMDLESLYFLGQREPNGHDSGWDGKLHRRNIYDNAFNGFQTAINAIGHQVSNSATTDWMNASSFVRLHIDCPISGGNPIAGTYGINLQQADGNTFTGGDVEGCATALHLGPNAQNNTIVGLRNENSTHQVVADAGSAYNNWITGGTMFTGAADATSGTHNFVLGHLPPMV